MQLIYNLKQDEQLLIEGFTSRRVVNGPGTVFVSPLISRVQRRKGTLLDNRQYIVITNTLTGEKRIERGPKLVFLGADEAILVALKAVTLKEDQYLRIKNRVSGAARIERGPQLLFLNLDDATDVDEDSDDEPQTATTLKEDQYLHVSNRASGVQRLVRGPQLFFPDVNDTVVRTLRAIPLKKDQYVRILNRETGVMRIERGEQSIYLNPNDETLAPPGADAKKEAPDNVRSAVKIDENTAILLRNNATGQFELVTEKGVFFPTADQDIWEIRKRVSLEDHQVMVIKDQTGRYDIRRGTDAARSFFLAPYEEVVPFIWSSGIHKDNRTLRIEALDLRPKFMWYEFEARTQDNVELTLGITFFWQVMSVESMIRTTDDATGDVCSHARSSIIQGVSQVSLERFLADFNNIVRRVVVESRDIFYEERGVVLNAVEVRSIACKDQKTQDVLMEIIQETTNRLNRLQKQESENEVRLRQIAGETEVEQSKGRLIGLQRENELNRAVATGEAEATRIAAFMTGLGNVISDVDKIAIYNLLRKGEVLHDLSLGSAQLYFTPADVNLSIESKK